MSDIEKVFITDGLTNDVTSYELNKYHLRNYMVCISSDEVPIIEHIRKCIKDHRSFYFNFGI